MSKWNSDQPTAEPALWIVGCGDLGTAVGRLALAEGWEVCATRRRAASIPREFKAYPGDVTDPELSAPQRCDALLYCVAATERSDEAYAAAYPEGLAHALAALSRAEQIPGRVLFVSSTSVWGGERGAWVDEQTPTGPPPGPPERILEAERLLARRLPTGVLRTSARLGGIYGPGRTAMIRAAARTLDRDTGPRQPKAAGTESEHWTNRIHRDDAARALWHLLQHPKPPEHVAVVDDHPSPRSAVLEYLRDLLTSLGAESQTETPPGAAAGTKRARSNRRISNRLLRSTGFDLLYPSYREGYGALLKTPEDVARALDLPSRGQQTRTEP